MQFCRWQRPLVFATCLVKKSIYDAITYEIPPYPSYSAFKIVRFNWYARLKLIESVLLSRHNCIFFDIYKALNIMRGCPGRCHTALRAHLKIKVLMP